MSNFNAYLTKIQGKVKTEPVPEILILITKVGSKCSGEPRQNLLARQSLHCSHTQSNGEDKDSGQILASLGNSQLECFILSLLAVTCHLLQCGPRSGSTEHLS